MLLWLEVKKNFLEINVLNMKRVSICIRESLILNVFILNSSYGSGKQLLK